MLTILVFAVVVGQGSLSSAAPMGTAFTYQGRLMDANEPADGVYEFEFKLYDSPTDGNQLDGTVSFRGVDVIDGYFTVELDFGGGVFGGDARWLEIGVRSDGSSPFTTLSPRQEVTPTPYALYTKTAGGVTVPLVLSGTVASPGAVISGTNDGTGYGVYGEATDTGDVTNYGGYFVARGKYGRAVYGEGTGESSRGIWGETSGKYGIGVQGNASGENSFGVYGFSSGDGAHGVVGLASGSTSRGVYGFASKTGDVENYGGYFEAAGSEGRGVYGKAMATGFILNYGGYFESAGDKGAGVRGESTGSMGGGVIGHALGSDGVGVVGRAFNEGDGQQYGGYFKAEGSSGIGVYGSGNGYAGYFVGNVRVTGTMSKGGGSFKIDHPLDPENKYLQHSFVESPDMMNVYNGNVLLDESGKAVVELPEYFEALNRDFRYQLTCIGVFAPVYIAEKISGNRFEIAGGKKGMEVSWQVTGIRQDVYAKANRIVVEEDKPLEARGYYLHPAAYGLPEEKGIEAVHNARFSETRQVAKNESR